MRNGKGMALYQQVLQKNFQIIQTFLNKFPSIFKKQDFFEQSIRKINQRLSKHQQQHDKIKDQIQINAGILQKKLSNLKQNNARRSRISQRASQEIIVNDQKKSSFFRMAVPQSAPKEEVFTKQKQQLLAAIDKKTQQTMKRIESLDEIVQCLQERCHFLSVTNGKLIQQVDHMLQNKVDKTSFQTISEDYKEILSHHTQTLVDLKYQEGAALIDQKITAIQKHTHQYTVNLLKDLQNNLVNQIQKKAGIAEMKLELSQIKNVIQKMVDESIDSFSNKQQTKQCFILFQKKISKLQTVMQEIVNGWTGKQDNMLMIASRRNKEGVMGNFGRRRKAPMDNGVGSYMNQ